MAAATNIISIKNRLPVSTETTVEKEIQEPSQVKKPRAKKVIQKSSSFISHAAQVSGLLVMILGTTSYLVYQNYDFFTAIIKSNQTITLFGAALSLPALMNSVVAELILLIAAAYTSSKKLPTKILAWTLMLGMICGLGFFMHASINNDVTGNTDYVQSLKQQKKDAQYAKESYEVEKNALDPLKWKSKRESLQNKINKERENIATLDSKIAEAKEVKSGNLESIIIYNTILRLAAMILNALLAHTLIARFVKP